MTVVGMTGSGGFIGRHASTHLRNSGLVVHEIDPRKAGWQVRLQNVDVVVHLAGAAHFTAARPSDYTVMEQENVSMARQVVDAASDYGVHHFVHISSVKAQDLQRPTASIHVSDDYSRLKRAVEIAVDERARLRNLPVWTTRLPLVYGPGVRANFLALLKAVHRGIPLPLGCASAPRSYVGIRNLNSAMLHCVTETPVDYPIIYIADAQPISTRDLVVLLAETLGTRAHLVPVPRSLMKRSLRAVGKGDLYSKLFDELPLDRAPATELLKWNPPFSTREELAWTVQWYLDSRSS